MSQQWRPHVGSTLDGRYAIEQVLGEGPTGVVYAAEDVLTAAPVAVKVFHPALFSGPHAATNLLRLQRARAYVNEHVVRLRDVVVDEARVYAVTDRMMVADLKRVLVGRGALLRREIPPLVEGIVDALAWIHQIGVHGNLKPSNIFVDEAGATRVGDPWFLEGADTIGPGELVARSGEWVAPEQLDGGAAERKETDVHGLARVVVRLLAGHSLQPGRTLAAQGIAVSEAVEAVLTRALSADPAARHATVSLFWSEFSDAWDGDAMRAGPTTGEGLRPPSRSTAPYGTDAVSAAILAGELGEGGGADGADDDDVAEAEVVDDLDGLEIEEDAGVVVGSETESIPLSEILAMGLDPVLGDGIEEVEAVLIDGAAAGQDVAAPGDGPPVIELDGGDVLGSPVEFETLEADEIITLDDADLLDAGLTGETEVVFGGTVAPGASSQGPASRPPASWDSGAEAAVLGGGASAAVAPGEPVGLAGASAVAAVTQRAASKPLRRKSPSEAGHSAVSAAESTRAPAGPAPGSRPVVAAPPRRNPMMVVAPLLLIVALAIGWYVLKSARERRQAPPRAVSAEARALQGGAATALNAPGAGTPAVIEH
ncbi:MAG: protein kinase, partial [Deltaproteobacteria bacterium]|nr:protein kinase [Deltaproteobacteria bacterium]